MTVFFTGLMIHWCLSVLALKVEKSFDDGGLRLTDKSCMPPQRCSPSLTLLNYVLHCYCYGNSLLFYFIFATKVQAEGRGAQYESGKLLTLYLLVCLPRLCLHFALLLSGSVHHTECTFVACWLIIEQRIFYWCSLGASAASVWASFCSSSYSGLQLNAYISIFLIPDIQWHNHRMKGHNIECNM